MVALKHLKLSNMFVCVCVTHTHPRITKIDLLQF
jgi:hypothetical protein